MRGFLRYLLLVVATALFSPCSGETVTNCLRLVAYSGDIWHLEGTQPLFRGLDLAVDKMADGWSLVSHHTRGWGYVARRKSMPAVSYLDFSERRHTVDITGTNDFYGLFNWHEDGPRTDLSAYNGWVHLRYENGELKIVNSAMGMKRGERVLFEDDPDFDPVVGGCSALNYQVIDGGSAVALVRPCLPADTEGPVVIPEKIGDMPVTMIDSGAFMGCWKITSVVVPSSVTRINSRAFADCVALTNVVIPATLERIGSSVFRGCTSLAEICLPGCAALSSDVVPETCRVTCRYPWDVDVADAPRPVGKILDIVESAWGVDRFDDHVELARKCLPDMASGVVSIPEKIDGLPVTAINQDAFYGNEWMTGLVIPNTVSNIGYKAIAITRNLQSLVIPDSVTNLGYCAVSDGYSLRDLVVGGGVVAMGEYAFANNDSLTNVVIRDGVRTISRGAFTWCRSLKTIVLPPSVELIDQNAFAGCNALESVWIFVGTRVESGAFPSGCRVSYSGPRMSLQGGLESEWHASYRPLLAVSDFDKWRSALQVDARLEEGELKPGTDPQYELKSLIAMGLSPHRYERLNNGTLEAFFARPQVRVVDFSPQTQKLVVRVTPASDSRIVRADEVQEIIYVQVADTVVQLMKGGGECLSSRDGVKVELSDYVKDGEIRIDLNGVQKKVDSQFFRLLFH